MNRFRKIKPRRQRLYFVLFSAVCLAGAAYFISMQFKENFMFFVTPHEVLEKKFPPGKTFKLGGLVKEDSIVEPVDGTYIFVVTDTHKDLKAIYTGILPTLFREGQGVVATGHLNEDGVFEATEILAKHDENYMPREVYEKIKQRELKGAK